jgi:hypothetical protein
MTEFSPDGRECLTFSQEGITFQKGGFVKWEAAWEEVEQVQIKDGLTLVRQRSGEPHQVGWESENIIFALRLFGRPEASFWKVEPASWNHHTVLWANLIFGLLCLVQLVWPFKPIEPLQVFGFAALGVLLLAFAAADRKAMARGGQFISVKSQPAAVEEALRWRQYLREPIAFGPQLNGKALNKFDQKLADRGRVIGAIAGLAFLINGLQKPDWTHFWGGLIVLLLTGFYLAVRIVAATRTKQLDDIAGRVQNLAWLSLSRDASRWMWDSGSSLEASPPPPQGPWVLSMGEHKHDLDLKEFARTWPEGHV